MGRSRSQMVSSSKVGQLQHQASAQSFQHRQHVQAGNSLDDFDFAAPHHHTSLAVSTRRTSNPVEISGQQTSTGMMGQINPIANFYNSSDGPYMVGSRTGADIYRIPNEPSSARQYLQPNPDVNYKSYPRRPHSDIGSAASGHYHHSDSGYGGSAAVPSERSFTAPYAEDFLGSTQPLSSQSSQFQQAQFEASSQGLIETSEKPIKTKKRKRELPPCDICQVIPTCPSDQK